MGENIPWLRVTISCRGADVSKLAELAESGELEQAIERVCAEMGVPFVKAMREKIEENEPIECEEAPSE